MNLYVTVLSFQILVVVVGFLAAIGFPNFYSRFSLLAIVPYAVAFARPADMEFARVHVAGEKISPARWHERKIAK